MCLLPSTENLLCVQCVNFRCTAQNVPVYRIEFADGTYLRTTANHRFPLKNGSEKTAIELSEGDALTALTSYSYKKRGEKAVSVVRL